MIDHTFLLNSIPFKDNVLYSTMPNKRRVQIVGKVGKFFENLIHGGPNKRGEGGGVIEKSISKDKV